MNKIKNKAGELTTQQIVMLIILITSFVVILFLLFRLDLGKETDKEICHNSVVMRGNSVLPKDAVSLNCKTEYICITEDGTCEGLIKPEIKKVKGKTEVYDVLANEMADCWWMFGEGKINYVGEDCKHNNYCSICSQILFDGSLENIEEIKDGKISKDELYEYLSETKMDGKETTYSEYLFNTNDINKLKKQSMEATGQEGEGTFGSIEISKQYFILMGITSEIGNTYRWIGGFGVVAGVVIGFTPIGWTAGAIVVGLSVVTSVGGEVVAENFEPEILALTVEGNGIENRFMAPTIQEIDSDKFKLLNCEEILTFQ
jgi:hypothetical protein